MNRFIAINPDMCIGCGTCLAACSGSHRAVGLQAEPRLSLVTTRDVSAAITCHHCEGAPCLTVCPVNAITREDGAVLVNEQTCIGCRMCGIVCPFGAIHPAGTSIAGVAGTMTATPTYSNTVDPLIRWEVGVYIRAVKCDLCGFDPTLPEPHCVAACPTHALTYVTGEEAASDAADKRKVTAHNHSYLQTELATLRKEGEQ